jgi:hypothetical protein
MSDTDPFIKNPRLQRSPHRVLNEQNAPTTTSTNNERTANKRGHEKTTTLDDIFNLIEIKSEKHSEKLDEVSASLRNEMTKLKAEINENFEKSLQNTDRKIDLVEKKADLGLRLAMDNQKMCINFMKQARLECCMDISGLKFNENNADLKDITLNTIKLFKININEGDIKKVTLYEVKKPNLNANKILTVTFEDVETKWRVMREKNKIKESNGIFFNATLTPANGYFMRKARYLTKGFAIKPKFYDGAVHVTISEGNTIMIQSEESLSELKKQLEDMPTSAMTSNETSITPSQQ